MRCCYCILGGYKGYGLAMLVEVLSGVLAGSAIGPDIRRWKGDDRIANLVRKYHSNNTSTQPCILAFDCLFALFI